MTGTNNVRWHKQRADAADFERRYRQKLMDAYNSLILMAMRTMKVMMRRKKKMTGQHLKKGCLLMGVLGKTRGEKSPSEIVMNLKSSSVVYPRKSSQSSNREIDP